MKKRMRRVLATGFALALSLSLVTPLASAADDHSVEMNVKESDDFLLTEVSFQVRNWDWDSEEDSLIKCPAEALTAEYAYVVPIGTSVRVIPEDAYDFIYLAAWSDPDGDGIYDGRISEGTRGSETYDEQAVLLPASYPGPATPTDTVLYMSDWPVVGHNSVDFTWTTTQNIENTVLSAAYLFKTFGPNTLVELAYYSVESDESTYYYFLLTDEKVDPALLETSNAVLSNSGAVASGWAIDTVNAAESAGLVPDNLFGADLTQNATRGDFAAASVKLYEAMSGQSAPDVTQIDPFYDANDIAIRQAYSLGFINGVGEGEFAPSAPLTREQAAVLMARVYEKLHGSIPAAASTSFADDGSVSSWAKSAVAFMSEKGIVNGVGNNLFSPQGSTTSEQALAIALRMFQNLK